MKTKTKAWVNLVLFLLTLVVNFLGGTGRINNSSQGEVSDTYQTLITPAGFTFSIWSVIYLLLFISMIVMLVKHEDTYYKKTIDRITPYLWLSYACNMIWIVLFSYIQIGLSTIFIFGYLFSLTFIVKKLKDLNQKGEWLLPLTFGLNTGWLFIASVVNVAAFLVQMDWQGFGISDTTWAAIMMVGAVLLVVLVGLNLQNAAFPLPIAWAFFGIFSELQSIGAGSLLSSIAIASMIFLLVVAVFMFIRNDKSIYPKHTV